ncbi:MAG: hypothetical protein COB67_02425 [SAR324 cluster bacterium]|uniref:DUF1294 domain-containing protein n=1 Tax=SAR324 cluster bacterium TaxID=2024889 RepID=A0A2A4T953_9DELT|nr:MAG: hypothetical protein COB67_02425 [SAR324 cluster bacterium]
MYFILIYMFVINLTTFLTFGYDKSQSRIQGSSRVSEKTLFSLSFIGGSLGGFIAQKYFRHKTKKLSFQVIFWVIVFFQIISLFIWWKFEFLRLWL